MLIEKKIKMGDKILTVCGKWHSRSNISKHRNTCLKCKRTDLTTENQRLRDRVAELEKFSRTTIVNNVNIGINVVNIVPFSQEPALDQEEVKSILEPAQDSISKYIKLKHFVRAGGNLRIPNKNQQRIEVFCKDEHGTNWVTKHKMDFIKELTNQSLCELVDLGAEHLSQEWRLWLQYIQSQILDLQIKNEEKMTKLVMYTILDAQKSVDNKN